MGGKHRKPASTLNPVMGDFKIDISRAENPGFISSMNQLQLSVCPQVTPPETGRPWTTSGSTPPVPTPRPWQAAAVTVTTSLCLATYNDLGLMRLHWMFSLRKDLLYRCFCGALYTSVAMVRG